MSTETNREEALSHAPVSWGRLARAAVISAVVALVINLAVFFLVPVVFGFTPEAAAGGPGTEPAPLTAFNVALATVVPAIVAALLMAALVRFTARPAAIFRIIAVVVLLLSLTAPLTQPVGLTNRLVLAALHVITAVVITYGLTSWASEA